MRIILGIGNPGRKYSFNRHNVGFMFLDYMAEKNSLSFFPSKGSFYYAEGNLNNFEYSLIKPTTYVNNSGIAALQALEHYKTNLNDFLVVADDLNLEFSCNRVRASGGDGGHNGISSIIYHLNSNSFPRIRIGIKNDSKNINIADFVLSNFNKDEIYSLSEVFKNSLTLSEAFIEGGTKKMMDMNSTLKDRSNNNNSSNNIDKGRI